MLVTAQLLSEIKRRPIVSLVTTRGALSLYPLVTGGVETRQNAVTIHEIERGLRSRICPCYPSAENLPGLGFNLRLLVTADLLFFLARFACRFAHRPGERMPTTIDIACIVQIILSRRRVFLQNLIVAFI